MIYGSTAEQVNEMRRKIEPYNRSRENSTFSAIATQLEDKTIMQVRHEISDFALTHMAHYAVKSGVIKELAVRAAKFIEMRYLNCWFESMAAPTCLLASKLYDLKVIVIRDGQRPWYFPFNDGRPITEDVIVMAQYFYDEGPKKGLSYYLPCLPTESRMLIFV